MKNILKIYCGLIPIDIDIMDTNMPLSEIWLLFSNIPVISTVIIITYSTPLFLVVAVPLFIAFYFIQVSSYVN